jgi:peptidoglycan hydrolase-like protein with peptidoglycan-binding domain
VPTTTPSPQLLEAQQLLGRLGYNVGTPDGVDGARTRSAIRAFQGTNGLTPDGVVSDGLLVLLRRQMKARMQQLSQGQGAGGARLAAASEDTSWFSAAARSLQRLLGRDFDSVRAPQELRSYCRANPETWIFDEGRGQMVLCGNVLSARPGTGEQLAQRRD